MTKAELLSLVKGMQKDLKKMEAALKPRPKPKSKAKRKIKPAKAWYQF